jgi:hypothetical protein
MAVAQGPLDDAIDSYKDVAFSAEPLTSSLRSTIAFDVGNLFFTTANSSACSSTNSSTSRSNNTHDIHISTNEFNHTMDNNFDAEGANDEDFDSVASIEDLESSRSKQALPQLPVCFFIPLKALLTKALQMELDSTEKSLFPILAIDQKEVFTIKEIIK